MPKIAVLLPCYNEALTIGTVVAKFRAALPTADIYVYDNNSSDATTEIARQAGAVVRRELRQGKGNVVRRMFADIDADVYILADGDDTYDASVAGDLVTLLIEEKLDFVNAARVSEQRPSLSAGTPAGECPFQLPRKDFLRSAIYRHAIRVQGSLATVRQILSGDGGRVRDGNRTGCTRAGAADAMRRDTNHLQRASTRFH